MSQKLRGLDWIFCAGLVFGYNLATAADLPCHEFDSENFASYEEAQSEGLEKINSLLPKATHMVGLSVVIMSDSSWGLKNINRRLIKASKIYSQCDIGLELEGLVKAKWKYPTKKLFFDLDNYFNERYPDSTIQLACDTPIKSRPLIYFLESFDDEIETTATAIPPLRMPKPSPVINTAWITNKLNEPAYEKRPEGYSELAHELGHLLLNDTHEVGPVPNLMHGQMSLLSGDLTAKQCKIMQVSPLVNKPSPL